MHTQPVCLYACPHVCSTSWLGLTTCFDASKNDSSFNARIFPPTRPPGPSPSHSSSARRTSALSAECRLMLNRSLSRAASPSATLSPARSPFSVRRGRQDGSSVKLASLASSERAVRCRLSVRLLIVIRVEFRRLISSPSPSPPLRWAPDGGMCVTVSANRSRLRPSLSPSRHRSQSLGHDETGPALRTSCARARSRQLCSALPCSSTARRIAATATMLEAVLVWAGCCLPVEGRGRSVSPSRRGFPHSLSSLRTRGPARGATRRDQSPDGLADCS